MSVPVSEKKPFPEDRALKLAKAREKALEVKRNNKEIRMRAELEHLESLKNKPVVEKEPEKIDHTEVDISDEDDEGASKEELTAAPPPAKPIKKKSKKQMVVIEQDSSDSDEFENNQNVVFVKRAKKKKQIEAPPIERQTPMEPSPPPPPQMTREQLEIQNYYENMFSGNFNMARRR